MLLFSFESPDIKVSIELYFNEQDQLVLEGYDIGKTVMEIWGDSDYEYYYTIQPEEVKKFYQLFGLTEGDKDGLLMELLKRFGVNEAYSLLGKFMDEHDIKYSSFSWT